MLVWDHIIYFYFVMVSIPPMVVSRNLQYVETVGSPTGFFILLCVFELALPPPSMFLHLFLFYDFFGFRKRGIFS